MTKFYLILVVSLTFISCKSKPVSNEPQRSVEVQSYPSKSTVIHALLISKEMDENFEDDKTHPCGKLPCVGNIVIQSIEQRGMNFNSQSSIGDTIKAHFTYTLGNSSKFFPQKNPKPNEVPLFSVLECTIASKPDGSFIVQDHKVLQHD